MYCPKCGKADQEQDSYCRQCGDYLPDFEKVGKGRSRQTPEDQFNISLTFNLMSAVAGIVMALAMIAIIIKGNRPPDGLIYAAVSLLIVISAWQIASFFNNLSLRKRFVRKSESEEESSAEVLTADTKELLPEADFANAVPLIVTEHSTRKLNDKASVRKDSEKDPK